jgi:hypothetical protein
VSIEPAFAKDSQKWYQLRRRSTMADRIKISLQDGTLVRHKNQGYQGKIEGITEIKACFTRAGVALAASLAKEPFQYRVVVAGDSMRHIAPAEDLEILDAAAEIVCFSCHKGFRSKPGLVDKPGGRCECGGWICPACLACQIIDTDSPQGKASSCSKHRKRLVKKLADGQKAHQSGNRKRNTG